MLVVRLACVFASEEMKEKYEAIDDSNRSRAHSQTLGYLCVWAFWGSNVFRFRGLAGRKRTCILAWAMLVMVLLRIVVKCDEHMSALEKIHDEVQQVFAEGAVEGYTTTSPGKCFFCIAYLRLMLLEYFGATTGKRIP